MNMTYLRTAYIQRMSEVEAEVRSLTPRDNGGPHGQDCELNEARDMLEHLTRNYERLTADE
jgi:hypothetical protein